MLALRAPVPAAVADKMGDDRQQDDDAGQGQHRVGRGQRDLAGADQPGDCSDSQKQRQVQQAAAAMAVEMVMPVMMAVAPVTAPTPATLFGLACFERKFVAHADIKFTHMIPYVSCGPIGRAHSIIMESSNTKWTHQKIII